MSYNKFLAKIASDLDKPRGFAILGRGEAMDFLGPRPVSLIWGVGAALQQRLGRDGIRTIADLRDRPEQELVAHYGTIGRRLARFARGEDTRRVEPNMQAKSVSVETTFERDRDRYDDLATALEPLCDRLAERLVRSQHAAAGITLKLKTSDFRIVAALCGGHAAAARGGGRHVFPPHRHRRRPAGRARGSRPARSLHGVEPLGVNSLASAAPRYGRASP